MSLGMCDTCKHAHFTHGDFGDFSGDFSCDMWDTEAWEEWENKLGKKMEGIGALIECPLWEPENPDLFTEPLSYCMKHLIWYGTKYGCPRCRAEEIVETEGGVMI